MWRESAEGQAAERAKKGRQQQLAPGAATEPQTGGGRRRLTAGGAALALGADVPQRGQPKRERLAAAGGGDADQVAPAQRDGQALRLDGAGLREVAGGVQLLC